MWVINICTRRKSKLHRFEPFPQTLQLFYLDLDGHTHTPGSVRFILPQIWNCFRIAQKEQDLCCTSHSRLILAIPLCRTDIATDGRIGTLENGTLPNSLIWIWTGGNGQEELTSRESVVPNDPPGPFGPAGMLAANSYAKQILIRLFVVAANGKKSMRLSFQ